MDKPRQYMKYHYEYYEDQVDPSDDDDDSIDSFIADNDTADSSEGSQENDNQSMSSSQSESSENEEEQTAGTPDLANGKSQEIQPSKSAKRMRCANQVSSSSSSEDDQQSLSGEEGIVLSKKKKRRSSSYSRISDSTKGRKLFPESSDDDEDDGDQPGTSEQVRRSSRIINNNQKEDKFEKLKRSKRKKSASEGSASKMIVDSDDSWMLDEPVETKTVEGPSPQKQTIVLSDSGDSSDSWMLEEPSNSNVVEGKEQKETIREGKQSSSQTENQIISTEAVESQTDSLPPQLDELLPPVDPKYDALIREIKQEDPYDSDNPSTQPFSPCTSSPKPGPSILPNDIDLEDIYTDGANDSSPPTQFKSPMKWDRSAVFNDDVEKVPLQELKELPRRLPKPRKLAKKVIEKPIPPPPTPDIFIGSLPSTSTQEQTEFVYSEEDDWPIGNISRRWYYLQKVLAYIPQSGRYCYDFKMVNGEELCAKFDSYPSVIMNHLIYKETPCHVLLLAEIIGPSEIHVFQIDQFQTSTWPLRTKNGVGYTKQHIDATIDIVINHAKSYRTH